MRYDWPVRYMACNGYTINSGVDFGQELQEVWIEVWKRFSENFSHIAPAEWGCTSARAYSWFQGRYPGAGSPGRGAGSFGLHFGPSGFGEYLQIRPPNDAGATEHYPFSVSEDIYNGEWVRMRIHIRVPSQPKTSDTSNDGSADGLMRWWAGDHMVENSGFSTVADGIHSIALGANRRQGPHVPMQSWWSEVRIWDEDPGWE